MMKLSLLSPERKLVDGESVKEVCVFTTEGQIEILPGHVDYAAQLESGTFFYVKENGKRVEGFISTGFVKVTGSHVSVLAQTLELANEIDKNRARRAQEKAEAMLKDAALEPEAFNKYQLKLQRSIIRQNIGN